MMSSPRIAVIGAGGFIGSRIVESFHLRGWAAIRPVVRRASALARSSRFKLESRIADACDKRALCAALSGCEYLIHAAGGDDATILEMVGPVFRAAQHAGVRRIVYLSSASVHGQSPQPGTDENSRLRADQPISYNNAKVRAERRFLYMRAKGNVEIVFLRPGIVYGPRSLWIGSFADELLTGRAFVVNGARGICNSIYVDNLVHAIRLALTADRVDGHAFLVGDQETVTWRDLYSPIVKALGMEFEEIPSVNGSPSDSSGFERIIGMRDSKLGKALLRILPARLRNAAYAGLSAWFEHQPDGSGVSRGLEVRRAAGLERTLLQTCSWKLSSQKAERMLGYSPQVSFQEGCRRCVEWLRFAGYPVVNRNE
ncbi:MAG TPA: NAD(P)-dependent oxidoreductase [Candidatus Sulfotelmatobacter sp.]|nr:NAD(P)-dependent oxidoreductase [Candidatus Sulfotelmatobacter sp.]